MERGPQIVVDGFVVETFKAHTTCGVLHCEAAGEAGGQVVILLHGHYPGASCHDWRVHMPPLADAGFRVWAFNFPGFGDAGNRSDGGQLPGRPDCVLMPGGAAACVLDVLALIYAARPGEEPRAALVGEGFGAAVALAIAEWEPSRVSAIALSHVIMQPGRFPFDGHELSILTLRVAVFWAEMGPGDGRDCPTLEACRGLQKAIPSSVLFTVAKKPLVPPQIGRSLPGESSSNLFLKVGGWPSQKVFTAARGNKKYIAQAQALVLAQGAGDKAASRAEANEYRARAKSLKDEIDKGVHQDRGRAELAGLLVAFFSESLLPLATATSLSPFPLITEPELTLKLDVLPELKPEPTPSSEPMPGTIIATPKPGPDPSQSAIASPLRSLRRSRPVPFYRHGMGMYEGEVASKVDPRGHGALSDRPLPLRVGDRVRASKSKNNRQGGQAAVYARDVKIKSPALSGLQRPPYQWRAPEDLDEQYARREVELGEPPLLDGNLVAATVVGVGGGGKRHTYALEYDDGDVEAHVHRLRIAGGGDPFADNHLTARPPSAVAFKRVATRRFPGGTRRDICVRAVGHASASPILLLHGSGPTDWSRDMRCLFEPLAAIGYLVICPDLPGFGDSPGKRWPSANESRHCDSGGPVEVLEDVLQAFNWRPASGKADDRPGSSQANNALDILGVSTGAALALSFCLKHGQAARSRVGALVLVNGVYRSGLDDAARVASACGDPEPPTARNDLARVRSKTLVLSVVPDPVHPRSFSAALAKNIPGALFGEVALPPPDPAPRRPAETLPLSHADTPAVDARCSPPAWRGTLPNVAPRGATPAPLTPANLAMLTPSTPKASQVEARPSAIPARRHAAKHCFEAHSGLVTPRLVNFLLRHGTPANRPGGANQTRQAADEADGEVRLLSPARTGLVAHQGPLVS